MHAPALAVITAVATACALAAGGASPGAPPRLLAGSGSERAHGSEAALTLTVDRGCGGALSPRPGVQPNPPPVALVTAPTEDRLLVVALPSGRVLRRIALPGGPEYVSDLGIGGPVAVVSARAATVTLLGGLGVNLRPKRTFGGFVAPHIVAMTPDGGYAYVTDDGAGRLVAIGLYDDRVISRTYVGAGAHHLAISPNLNAVWVALGQSARSVTTLSTRVPAPPGLTGVFSNPGRPHVTGRFEPPFAVHDLSFTPDGRDVWMTSASGSGGIGVFDARNHRLLYRVPGGRPPQHLAFAGRYAYVTSGYGSSIEQVRWSDGHVLRRVWAPYGSFELDTAGRWVLTASLLRGTLAIYDRDLRLVRVVKLAPSVEDVSIYDPDPEPVPRAVGHASRVSSCAGWAMSGCTVRAGAGAAPGCGRCSWPGRSWTR